MLRQLASRNRVRAGGFAFLAALALALGSLLWPGTSSAEGALVVTQVGWDGTIVPGAWSPVRVRVSGGSADLTARVEVLLKSRFPQGPQGASVEYPAAAYGQDLALPAGVTKEVTIWAPIEANMAGVVRLMAGNQVLADEEIEFRTASAPYWPLVGVLAEAPTVARSLSQIELPYQGLPIPLSVARLTAAEIPPAAERLNALSALVVQGNVTGSLTGEQRRAIEEWVAAGGHLVIAGGPDAPRAVGALPPGSLPLSFGGVETTADLTPIGQWADASGTAPLQGPAVRFTAPTGAILAGTPEQPLAWRLSLDQGTVTLLAADPALEPLASWSGTSALLRQALEPALPSPGENASRAWSARMFEANRATRFQGAIEALPPEAFPDWSTVALILGGFALVVGPLAYLVLRRLDRREWVWVAVPALAVLVTGSLYVVGVGRGGRDVLANVLSAVRLDPATGQARQSLVAGFFAPTHPELTVRVTGDVPVRAMSGPVGVGPYGPIGQPLVPATTEPPFRVMSGQGTDVEFLGGQWTMRSVALERTLGAEVGGITAHLGVEGGLVQGTLRNDTPYPLEDAAVVAGQSLAKLGSLAPGQTVPVVLEPMPAANPFGGPGPGGPGGASLSYRLFGRPAGEAVAGRPPAKSVAPAVSPASKATPGSPQPPVLSPPMPERLDLPRDPEVSRRVRLLDPLLNAPGPRSGPGGPALPLTFLAFTRAAIGSDFPSAGDHPAYYLSLLEQPLRLDLPAGPFALPAELIPADLGEIQAPGGLGGGGNGQVTWLELRGGSVTYSFRPPLPDQAGIEALRIRTRQVGGTSSLLQGPGGPPPPPPASFTVGPAEEGIYAVYNWQSATWDPLPGGQEEVRVEPAAPYVGPEQEVRIQVRVGSDQLVRFVQPELAVEGSVRP